MGEEANEAVLTIEPEGARAADPASASGTSGGDRSPNEAGKKGGVSDPGTAAVDERGVPLPNVVGELRRKLQEAEERERTLLYKLNQGKTADGSPGQEDVLPEVDIDEMFPNEIFNDGRGFVERLLKAIDMKIERKEKEYSIQGKKAVEEQNAKRNAAIQAEFAELKEAEADFGEKGFGHVLKKLDNGNFVVDTSSDLIVRANHIKQATGKRNYECITKALLQLQAERPGVGGTRSPQGIDRLGGVQRGGSAVTRPAAGIGPLQDDQGNFLREASDSEYFALSDAEKARHDQWEVSKRNE